MRLTDLFPQFIRIREATDEEIAEHGWSGARPMWLLCPVDTLAEADGIRFTDPLWARDHPGQDGLEFGAGVHVAFAGRDPEGIISRNSEGRPTAWAASGTGYGDLRLTPSIFINPKGNPPGWHGFIGLAVPGGVTSA